MNIARVSADFKRALLACTFILSGVAGYAQPPNCNAANPIIYMVTATSNGILNYDPSQPWSATNPSTNSIPAPGINSLAVSANLNGPGPSPTFYQVIGTNYYYWNGTTWANTGHTSGAVNPAGGAGFIYSLIGGTGEVYRYDGTGNATLITTIPDFLSGPYDLFVDCADNFYALRTNAAAPSVPALLMYDPNGNLLNSWTMNGPPAVFNGGGGLAVWNNNVYFNNQNVGGGIWHGIITGGTVNFTLLVPQTTIGTTIYDFGTCPLKTVGSSKVDAIPDTVYYCGTGPGKSVTMSGVPGTTTATWSVLSGNATITGSGSTVTVTATTTSQIVLDGTITNSCGTISGKDTVLVVVPTATLDAGVTDTFFGCGDYIDTLHGSLTNNQPWLSYNLDWTPIPYVQSGGNTLKPVVNPPADGWFFLTATTDANKGSCSWRDSVYIKTTDADVTGKFGMDVHLGCDEDTVLFLDTSTSKLGALTYKWMYGDGAFDTVLKASHIYKKQSIYQVIQYIDNGHCKDTIVHSVDLNHPLQAIFSFDDSRVCQKDTIEFDASASVISKPLTPQKYYWDFGDFTKDSLKIVHHAFMDPIAYPVTLVVYDSLGCTDTVVRMVENIIPLPSVVLGPEDTTICTGEKLYLPLGISAHGNQWVWSDGTTEPRKIVSKAGTYIVQLYNECGFTADTIKVNFKNCSIFVPNGFTPNGDGKNDKLNLLGNKFDVTDCEWAIFNRWGVRLFYTSSQEEGWDGTYKDEPQDVGTYYYIVKYRIHGEWVEMKGDVTLVR